MKIEVELTLIGTKKMEQRDFPCLCAPFYEETSYSPKKYMWEHAGFVDAVIRGSADYFKVETITQKQVDGYALLTKEELLNLKKQWAAEGFDAGFKKSGENMIDHMIEISKPAPDKQTYIDNLTL